MKEFIEKLIERFLAECVIYAENYEKAISIVNQLTKEYKPCNKPSCKDCEVYDKEKHYCPKWCDVIKHTTEELAEEYNGGWIPFTQRELSEEEKDHYGEDIKYMLDCKLPEEDEEILVTYRFKDKFYVEHDIFLKDGSMCCLDSGRELIDEAIAWQPIPGPFKPIAE